MKSRCIYLLFLLLSTFGTKAFAQVTVEGSVYDENNTPLIGVSIVADDHKAGTITDVDGRFSIMVPNLNARLTFSYVGYETQEVALKGRKSLKVVMREDAELLDEVIVVGYGTQKKINVTGSIAQVGNKELKKGEIEAQVDAKYTAQDWEGFQELVSKSNIQDKDLILRVLSMYQDPEQRETEIKNISSVYKTLADEILPQLRRARLTANYDVIGRSDEEINAAFDAKEDSISVDELLYAATLTQDNARKEAIYKRAIEKYPNDFRAYNNLGMMSYAAGDLNAAENYFKQAASKSASAAEVNTNLGLCELCKGNVAEAETYLSKSTGANTANEALGNLYIKQGQYDRAVQAFGDTKTNSAALAQILAKDYNKAKSTLEAVKNPDAYTDYLMAIVGARTNNADLVKSSMAKVGQKDASLKASAQNDREFAKYANEIQ